MSDVSFRATAVLGLGLAAALVATNASAGLLDAPPKLQSFKLDDPSHPKLTLLQAFHDAETERPGAVKNYLRGPWGRWMPQPWWTLAWQPEAKADEPLALAPTIEAVEEAAHEKEERALLRYVEEQDQLRFEPARQSWLPFAAPSKLVPSFQSTGLSFASNGFDALWDKPVKPIRDWRCRRRPVRFIRFAAETDAFELVKCDGSIAPEAFDRLTIIARPTDVAKPGELLPDEPDATAWSTEHEWLPGVRLVSPRLLWALQRLSDAFPWRPIYVFSGYRPHNKGSASGSHNSMHAAARAMDISVMGIRNEDLFRFCRTLDDVGCGYYPNSKFVHVDVRKPGTGHAFWIDDSGPGEPSHYIDSWPGVIEKGALSWNAKLQEQRRLESVQTVDAGSPPAP